MKTLIFGKSNPIFDKLELLSLLFPFVKWFLLNTTWNFIFNEFSPFTWAKGGREQHNKGSMKGQTLLPFFIASWYEIVAAINYAHDCYCIYISYIIAHKVCFFRPLTLSWSEFSIRWLSLQKSLLNFLLGYLW